MKKMLHHIVLAVLAIACILFLNVGFIFILLGFLPTVVAYFIDETPNKDLYKTVRASNGAGMLPTLSKMTESNAGDAGAVLQVAMSDPKTWLVVYGAAACGWGLIWVCKWLALISIMAAGQARIGILEAHQKDLVEEWGEELKEYVITTQ